MVLAIIDMRQYTIIYKYGKRTHQLKIKRKLKIFPQETMAASENRFTPELNEKEVTELLEELCNILGAFLIKQLLFHSHLFDMRRV